MNDIRINVTDNISVELEVALRNYEFFALEIRQKITTVIAENHLAWRDGILYFVDLYAPQNPHWHKLVGNEKGIILSRRSRFQHIQIFHTVSFGLMLVLDGYPQAAERDSHIYHEALALPALLIHPSPKRILIGGGGDGALLSTLLLALKDLRIEEVVLVDIDEDVVALTQEYMPSLWRRVEKDSRVKILHEDILHFVENTEEKFDIFYYDLTEPDESALALPVMSPQFFERAKGILRDKESVFSMQGGARSAWEWESNERGMGLLSGVLPQAISYYVHIPSFSTSWSFILARGKELPALQSQGVAEILFKNRYNLVSNCRYLTTPELFAALFALPTKI